MASATDAQHELGHVSNVFRLWGRTRSNIWVWLRVVWVLRIVIYPSKSSTQSYGWLLKAFRDEDIPASRFKTLSLASQPPTDFSQGLRSTSWTQHLELAKKFARYVETRGASTHSAGILHMIVSRTMMESAIRFRKTAHWKSLYIRLATNIGSKSISCQYYKIAHHRSRWPEIRLHFLKSTNQQSYQIHRQEQCPSKSYSNQPLVVSFCGICPLFLVKPSDIFDTDHDMTSLLLAYGMNLSLCADFHSFAAVFYYVYFACLFVGDERDAALLKS